MYEKCFIIFNMTDYVGPTWLNRFIGWPDNDKIVMVTDYKFQYFVSLQSKLFFFYIKIIGMYFSTTW